MSFCDTADYTNWPLRTVWYVLMMSAIVTAAFPLMKATDPDTQFLVWFVCASALMAVISTFGDEKIDFTCCTIATIAFYLAGMALLLTCGIEFIQLFISRYVEIDDVILNFLGVMGGAGLWWIVHRCLPGMDKHLL